MPPAILTDLQFWLTGGAVTVIVGLLGMRNGATSQLIEALKRSDQLARDNQTLAQQLAITLAENSQLDVQLAQISADRDRAHAESTLHWERADQAVRDRDACRADCAELIGRNGLLEAEVLVLTRQAKELADLRSERDAVLVEEARRGILEG